MTKNPPKRLYDCHAPLSDPYVDPGLFPVDRIAAYCAESGDEFYAIGCPMTLWGDPSRFRVGTLRWGGPVRGLTITFKELDAWWLQRQENCIGAGI